MFGWQETEKKRLSNDAAPNPDWAGAEPHLISTSGQGTCRCFGEFSSLHEVGSIPRVRLPLRQLCLYFLGREVFVPRPW